VVRLEFDRIRGLGQNVARVGRKEWIFWQRQHSSFAVLSRRN
jgi:hypothetical protein